MAYQPNVLVDESTYTEGTSPVAPVGGEFNDASADVTAGKVAAIRITKKRAGHVNLRDSVGAEFGTVGNPLFTTATGSGGAVTIADGADVAEGTTTDAAVTTDANGTVIGFLRGVVKILNSVWDSLNGRLKVDASAVAVPVTDNSGSLTVDDGGGSLTVDGPLTDAQLRATPVPISGTVTITDGSGPVTVDGTVAATQSGTWTVQPGNTANTTAWKVDASSVAVPVTDNSGSLSVDDGGGSLTVDGPLTDTQLRAAVVPIGDGGGSLTVDGTVATTQGTSPWVVGDGAGSLTVDGPLTDAELRATPVPVSGTVTITDGSGPVTVDGTVAATQSGTWTVQPGNTANTTAWKVDGSAVTQPVSGPLTDTQLRATPVPVSGTVTITDGSGPVTVDGTVAATQSGTWTVQPGNTANTTAWKVDASSVAVPVTDNSGSLTVDDGGGSLTVDGPLTNTELRASAVPVSGSKTHNSAVPTTDNLGVLPAVANQIAPALTEGDQVLLSVDLGGQTRVVDEWGRRALRGIAAAVDRAAEAAAAAAAERWTQVRHRATRQGAAPSPGSDGRPMNALCNTSGVAYVIGGHPNTQSIRATYSAAQTNTVLVANSIGLGKLVVTRVMATADAAMSVTGASVIVGVAPTITPTTTGVAGSHPGIGPGGGFVTGDGSGILVAGNDGDQILVTSGVATGGSLDVVVSYYLLPS